MTNKKSSTYGTAKTKRFIEIGTRKDFLEITGKKYLATLMMKTVTLIMIYSTNKNQPDQQS